MIAPANPGYSDQERIDMYRAKMMRVVMTADQRLKMGGRFTRRDFEWLLEMLQEAMAECEADIG